MFCPHVEHLPVVQGETDSGLLKLQVGSEIYDDTISALTSNNTRLEVAVELLSDLQKTPHET